MGKRGLPPLPKGSRRPLEPGFAGFVVVRPSSTGGEVLVLHLPCMVERVEGRVSDQERQRPRPHAPSRPPRRCRHASRRRRSPDTARSPSGVSAAPSGIRTESEDFAKQVGLRIPEEAALTPDGLRQHRETYVAAMRAYNAGEVERRMRSWTLPFLIRHSAFHTLDHAWEMEDKDLSALDGA